MVIDAFIENAIGRCMPVSQNTDNIWLALAAYNCAIAMRRLKWSDDCELRMEKVIDRLQTALSMTNESCKDEGAEEGVERRKATGRFVVEAQTILGW